MKRSFIAALVLGLVGSGCSAINVATLPSDRSGETIFLSAGDIPEAYETLLLDVMLGYAALFMRADQVEAAWSVVMPALEAWETVTPMDFPNYTAGVWGPEAAKLLIAQDGRSWAQPTIAESGQTADETTR